MQTHVMDSINLINFWHKYNVSNTACFPAFIYSLFHIDFFL